MIRALLCASFFFQCSSITAQEVISYRLFVDVLEYHFSGLILFQKDSTLQNKQHKIVLMSETGITYANLQVKSNKKLKGYLVPMLRAKMVKTPLLNDIFQFTQCILGEEIKTKDGVFSQNYTLVNKDDTVKYTYDIDHTKIIQSMNAKHSKSGMSIQLTRVDL